ELYAVATSPNEPLLVATGGGDDKGFMWKIGHGDWAKELPGHRDSVTCLAFSSISGKLLATEGGGIEWVRWHPRGYVVLAGSEDSTAWMWNGDKNVFLNMFSGHSSTVTCGDFTPDGKMVCTGSEDASLRIWNPRNGECVHVVRDHPYHTEGLTCLAITSDSTLAITGSKDNSIHIVNITTGRVHSAARCTCEHEEGVTCLAWLGASPFVATGSVDGKVRVWVSLSGDCVTTFSGHSDAIQSISVLANGEHLVSVSLDGTVRVFELN
ncbi:hypothetical protein IFM89_027792, partial [Coptis chinensis]